MFDKEKFAELLKKAKGKRSINAYAEECGVTAAHISRLLRGIVDTAPTPPTIKKLADHAHNDVTYEDLMLAAGYFDSDQIEYIENQKILQYIKSKLPLFYNVQEPNDLPSHVKEEIEKILEEGPNQLGLYLYKKIMGQSNSDFVSKLNLMPAKGERIKLPIIGTVKAGMNGLAFEDKEGYEWVYKDEINGGEYFWLRVSGDSMIDEGILPGDLALVRIQPDVDHGDLAVVIIDNEEGTLKKVLKFEEGIILQPANRKYQPRYFFKKDLERIRIVGKVKETKRKY